MTKLFLSNVLIQVESLSPFLVKKFEGMKKCFCVLSALMPMAHRGVKGRVSKCLLTI